MIVSDDSGDMSAGLRIWKTLSASTIVHAFSNVGGFFKWLRRQVGYDRIPEDLVDYFSAPRHLIQIANAPVKKAYPTHEEVVTAVGSMPTDSFLQRRNRALVTFVYLTGVRVATLITLRLKNATKPSNGSLVQILQGVGPHFQYWPARTRALQAPYGDDVSSSHRWKSETNVSRAGRTGVIR